MIRTMCTVALSLLVLIHADCKKNTSSAAAMEPTNQGENVTVSDSALIKDTVKSSIDRKLTISDNDGDITSDSTAVHKQNGSSETATHSPEGDVQIANSGALAKPLGKGTSGFKVLPVTKIKSCGDSRIEKDELKKFVYDKSGDSSTPWEVACNDEQRNVNAKVLREKWYRVKRSSSDTSHLCFDNSGKIVNDPSEKYQINYYYVRSNGMPVDSLCFVGHDWRCPDYRTFLVYPPLFVDLHGIFNYVGKNSGAAAGVFTLKPFFWDGDMKMYTKYSPTVRPEDSSSLMVNSVTGFEIAYKECMVSESAPSEKQIVFNALADFLSSASCIFSMTMEKLATVNGVSRFVGLVNIGGGFTNSWYLADIVDDRCIVTVLGMNEAWYNPGLYCAYAFGEGNLPDVFVWQMKTDYDVAKEIYYMSKNRWVLESDKMEYAGDCNSDE